MNFGEGAGSGKKVAVVLCGCGKADGSEIHESVSLLVHLSRQALAYECFAPDAPQHDVVNHATGKVTPGLSRNMMVEAARITRGVIRPLSDLKAADFDGVVFPGGFGAAKNLCDFASKGADCAVIPDAARVITEFHGAKKPIGLICIAPVLAARVLGRRMNGPGCRVTIGTDAATAQAIATMGSDNLARGVRDVCTDDAHMLVSTPAYMYDATPHEVFEGIGKLVDTLTAMLKRR